ncbi:alpha/beta fold hydrolase [Marinobacter sp. SS21]|uniref:alpha/beta fold hydrolase n=1 Tax=Marinobacter sp. SS21 TaxID=2979460 RepID=UPI00232AE534|nr:alpha/beta fold hydrolase [Marinobacter sp. SS21]MDC0662399.1 alpha/beta fold hydrolase [Marinobacter sp. SS21]
MDKSSVPARTRLLAGLWLAGLSLVLAGCSRQDLYDAAIAWERDAAGLQQQTLQAGDLNIAYLTNQQPNAGANLVMLHGFAGNKDNWVRMAGALSAEFNVFAIDLPGHGDSSKELTRSYRLTDQVRYVEAVLAQLGLTRVHMMGNSMGGAVTVLYAAQHPERLQSAVLFNPAGVFEYESEFTTKLREGDNPLIVRQPGDFKPLVDFVMEKKPFVPWPIYQVLEEKALANRPVYEHIFATLRESSDDQGFRQALSRIADPVLIIWGTEDRVIDYRNAELFEARIPQADTVLLEQIGHVPMIEVPERSAELIRQFVGRHSAATDAAAAN